MELVRLKLIALFFTLLGLRLVFTLAPGLFPRVRKRITDAVDAAVAASVIAVLLVAFAFQLTQVSGQSMEPSLHDTEFTVVNKLVYHLHPLQRGDVIVMRSPIEEDTAYIKRVIALPGERVEVRLGRVVINGLYLNEPYVRSYPEVMPERRVPPRHVFVMGDNRPNSTDSRAFGPIGLDQVVGRASLVIWPAASWRMIRSFEGRRLQAAETPTPKAARVDNTGEGS